jgi:3-hydroxyisobutyrate dehydrogenase-like beta-hydroxyacid dehydrogenase
MAMELVGIGGLGLMLSPSARHLKPGGPARFLRIHDRGTRDARRDACRRQWEEHGARLVHRFEDLILDGDFDGIVICAGKNGDDAGIIRSIVPLIKKTRRGFPFILHLSTVSSGFVKAAHDHLNTLGIDYANYPLTGGPLGAEAGSMLILASGEPSLYRRLEPTLETIGNPRFFGPRVTAGAEAKLIGQLMVFNGLMGICSAAALKAECFEEDLTGSEQGAFFDFLNAGAGGTRQWDVALSKGIRDNVWDQGFMIHHAVVDAIYAAELCRERGLPDVTIMPVMGVALTFAYLLMKHKGIPLATHAIAGEMLRKNARDMDVFLKQHLDYRDIGSCIRNCIEVLPLGVKKSVMLDMDPSVFVPS